MCNEETGGKNNPLLLIYKLQVSSGYNRSDWYLPASFLKVYFKTELCCLFFFFEFLIEKSVANYSEGFEVQDALPGCQLHHFMQRHDLAPKCCQIKETLFSLLRHLFAKAFLNQFLDDNIL